VQIALTDVNLGFVKSHHAEGVPLLPDTRYPPYDPKARHTRLVARAAWVELGAAVAGCLIAGTILAGIILG
jgi:hypothetical protein